MGLFALFEAASLSRGIVGATEATHYALTLAAGVAARGASLLASVGSAALSSRNRNADPAAEAGENISLKPVLELSTSEIETVGPESSSTAVAVRGNHSVDTLAVLDDASVADHLPSPLVYVAESACRPRLVGGAKYDIPASTHRGKLECRVTVVQLLHDGAIIRVSASGKVFRGLWWRKGNPEYTFPYYVRCDSGADGCVLVGSFIGQQRVVDGSVTIDVRVEQTFENGLLQANFSAWAGLLPSSVPDVAIAPVTIGNWPSAKLELPVSIGAISWKCESVTSP